MQSEITVKNLKKYFAEIKAVDDISFTVQMELENPQQFA